MTTAAMLEQLLAFVLVSGWAIGWFSAKRSVVYIPRPLVASAVVPGCDSAISAHDFQALNDGVEFDAHDNRVSGAAVQWPCGMHDWLPSHAGAGADPCTWECTAVEVIQLAVMWRIS